MRDPANKWSRRINDSLGRLKSVEEDPNGSIGTFVNSGGLAYSTSYTYDSRDQLKSVIQGGRDRSFTYDPLGRLQTVVSPEMGAEGTPNGTITYSYDPAGNLISKFDARSVTTSLFYDIRNRVKKKTYSGVTTPEAVYCYDGDVSGDCAGAPTGTIFNLKGRLTRVKSTESTTDYLEYDALGRVRKSLQTTAGMAALSPFEYTYDEAGLNSVKYPSGRTISYDFDLAGRVKSVTGTLAAASKTYISGIDYSAHGAIEEMTYGGGTVRKQRYCYNNRLQMSGMVLGQNPASNCASADTTLMRLFMGYGAANNGNLDSQDIAADGFLVRQNYTYDKLNRLETAIEGTLPTAGSTGWKQTNGYDRWGNRWVSDLPADTYPSNLTAQANSSSWFTAKNRLNSLGGFDNAGNQTSANGFTLSYDAENRLTTAVHGTNTSKNQVYSYDAAGQRVKQVSGTGGVMLTTYFVYDAMGGLAAEYEVKTGEYPTPAAQCTTCYLAQDHLGSTRALWDDTGVKARFDYLPFGEAISGDRNGRAALTCAAGVTNCYNGPGSLTQKFTGKERDAETGLDYFGARYMSSAQGRFTSPDPHNPLTESRSAKELSIYISEPQNWNRYAYTRNNPLNFFDPDGRETKLAVGKQTRENPAGHVALVINGKVYSFGTNYSQGPNKDWGGAASSYLGQQAGLRETDLLTLNVSDKQEKQLEQTLQNNDPNATSAPPYSLIGNSCVNQCERALVSTGILQNTPPGPVVVGRGGAEFQSGGTQPSLTPGGLADRVQSQGLVASAKTVGQQQVSKPESFWNALKRLFE
jgi:RHS repeat-associated protein